MSSDPSRTGILLSVVHMILVRVLVLLNILVLGNDFLRAQSDGRKRVHSWCMSHLQIQFSAVVGVEFPEQLLRVRVDLRTRWPSGRGRTECRMHHLSDVGLGGGLPVLILQILEVLFAGVVFLTPARSSRHSVQRAGHLLHVGFELLHRDLECTGVDGLIMI